MGTRARSLSVVRSGHLRRHHGGTITESVALHRSSIVEIADPTWVEHIEPDHAGPGLGYALFISLCFTGICIAGLCWVFA